MTNIVRSALLVAVVGILLAPPVVEARGRARGEAHYRHGYGHSRGYVRHHGHGSHLSLGLTFGSYYRHAYYQPYPYVVYTAPVVYSSGPREVYGRIDTDIKPSSATVYLDGKAVGIADDFDGYPSNLYVTPGKHTVSFREPGYQTMHVDLDVVPFHKVRVKERMQLGADTWEPPVPADDDDDDDDDDDAADDDADNDDRPPYHRRESDYRSPSQRGPYERPAAYLEPSFDHSPRREVRTGAELVLEVYPPDATVYVDGEAQAASGVPGSMVLPLSPGEHRIEVAKPGFEVFSGELKLQERQRQELRIRLDPKSAL